MKIKIIFLFLLASAVFSQNIFFKGIPFAIDDKIISDKNDYAGVNKILNSSEKNTKQISESPIRRGEIMFFISLPFAFLYSYLIVEGVKAIVNYDEVKKEWMDIEFIFIGINSISWSASIAFNDYKKNR